MSAKLQRFDFTYLRDFRGPIVNDTLADDIAAEEEQLPPPPPVFSESQLEIARQESRKQGFSEGFEAGHAQAKREADAVAEQANQTIHALGKTLARANADYQQLLTREGSELSALILSIAKKVTNDALKDTSTEAILAMVEKCLPVLFSKPKVLIDLHPDMLEPVIARIEQMLQAGGFEGEIQFRTNPLIGVHDVQLDWGSGQASRNVAAMWQEIESLLTQMPPEVLFNNETTEITSDAQPIPPISGDVA